MKSREMEGAWSIAAVLAMALSALIPLWVLPCAHHRKQRRRDANRGGQAAARCLEFAKEESYMISPILGAQYPSSSISGRQGARSAISNPGPFGFLYEIALIKNDPSIFCAR